MNTARSMVRPLIVALALVGVLGAGGCSLWGGASKPKPAELGPNIPVLGVRQAWTAKIGSVEGVALDVATEAMRLAAAKLSLRTKLITREFEA